MGEVNIRVIGVRMKSFDTNKMCKGENNPLSTN